MAHFGGHGGGGGGGGFHGSGGGFRGGEIGAIGDAAMGVAAVGAITDPYGAVIIPGQPVYYRYRYHIAGGATIVVLLIILIVVFSR
jgi:hypothetical protein